jgi:hypothetical protein
LLAASGTAAIAAPVAVLVEGVVHAMWMTKIKITVGLVLVLGVFTAGAGVVTYGGLHAQAPVAQTPAVQTPPASQEQPPAQRTLEQWKELMRGRTPEQVMAITIDLPDLPDNHIKRMMAALPQDNLTPLLKDQYEAVQKESRARWQEFLAGRGTLAMLIETFQRLLQAEIDLSTKRPDWIAAYEAQLIRTQLVESINEARYNAGRISIQDYEQTRFVRIRAQIMLERIKSEGRNYKQ